MGPKVVTPTAASKLAIKDHHLWAHRVTMSPKPLAKVHGSEGQAKLLGKAPGSEKGNQSPSLRHT